MRIQIVRLSYLQNSKLTAILYGIASLLLYLPIGILLLAFPPEDDPNGGFFVIGFAIALPVLAGIFAFISIAIYNLLAKYACGFEFTTEPQDGQTDSGSLDDTRASLPSG